MFWIRCPRHSLDDMANHYLNLKTTTFEEVAGKGVKQLTFNKVNLDVASDYAAEDAISRCKCTTRLVST